MITILHAIQPLYVMSGLVVGTLVGMTGVGGGSLMTPILILLFGIHPLTAVGTDLLYASATKTCGTLVHGWNRTIDWSVVGRLAMGSVPFTALTIFALSKLDMNNPAAQKLITSGLGIALFLTALSLAFRKTVMEVYARRVGEIQPTTVRNLTIAMGAILGVLVSISSVGAGAIGVTALILLYPKMPTARIVGSDIAHAVPLTLIAGLGHWWLGSINFLLLGSLLIGSIPGIVLGSTAAMKVPEPGLRFVLASVLVLVCFRFWFF
ncbi:MAG TPA: sulfite exporter TauE/SafE family protein [Rhizomicrobium sp.]